MEALNFIWIYLVVIPSMLALFFLSLWYFIRKVKIEMNTGLSLSQALKKNIHQSKGYVIQSPKINYNPSFKDIGYTSTDYATNPMFSYLHGNIHHRRTDYR